MQKARRPVFAVPFSQSDVNDASTNIERSPDCIIVDQWSPVHIGRHTLSITPSTKWKIKNRFAHGLAAKCKSTRDISPGLCLPIDFSQSTCMSEGAENLEDCEVNDASDEENETVTEEYEHDGIEQQSNRKVESIENFSDGFELEIDYEMEESSKNETSGGVCDQGNESCKTTDMDTEDNRNKLNSNKISIEITEQANGLQINDINTESINTGETHKGDSLANRNETCESFKQVDKVTEPIAIVFKRMISNQKKHKVTFKPRKRLTIQEENSIINSDTVESNQKFPAVPTTLAKTIIRPDSQIDKSLKKTSKNNVTKKKNISFDVEAEKAKSYVSTITNKTHEQNVITEITTGKTNVPKSKTVKVIDKINKNTAKTEKVKSKKGKMTNKCKGCPDIVMNQKNKKALDINKADSKEDQTSSQISIRMFAPLKVSQTFRQQKVGDNHESFCERLKTVTKSKRKKCTKKAIAAKIKKDVLKMMAKLHKEVVELQSRRKQLIKDCDMDVDTNGTSKNAEESDDENKQSDQVRLKRITEQVMEE